MNKEELQKFLETNLRRISHDISYDKNTLYSLKLCRGEIIMIDNMCRQFNINLEDEVNACYEECTAASNDKLKEEVSHKINQNCYDTNEFIGKIYQDHS